MSALGITWFFLVGIILTGYAILDGFDLGVGCWYLFTKKKSDRKKLLTSIAPFWDGNEVWLLTGGGAIFAAFPHVYATVFSGFYLALMLVIFALIFRAVSIEYISYSDEKSSNRSGFWDKAFGIGSFLPALLFGVALGNILRGIPLDGNMNFTGSFFTLLNPFAILIGLLGLSMFATHGALYVALKTDQSLAKEANSWAKKSWLAYLILFIIAVLFSLLSQPQLFKNYLKTPILWIVPLIAIASIILIEFYRKNGQIKSAFITSSISIAALMGMCGISLFPNLVPALNNPNWSLTITNSSSSELTLLTMLILALIGMPIVLGYTIWIYAAFRGKVKDDDLVYEKY